MFNVSFMQGFTSDANIFICKVWKAIVTIISQVLPGTNRHFSTYNVLYKQRRAVVDETIVYNQETLTWVYEQILKWYSITVVDSCWWINIRNVTLLPSNTAEDLQSSSEFNTLKQQCGHVRSSKFETTLIYLHVHGNALCLPSVTSRWQWGRKAGGMDRWTRGWPGREMTLFFAKLKNKPSGDLFEIPWGRTHYLKYVHP